MLLDQLNLLTPSTARQPTAPCPSWSGGPPRKCRTQGRALHVRKVLEWLERRLGK